MRQQSPEQTPQSLKHLCLGMLRKMLISEILQVSSSISLLSAALLPWPHSVVLI